MIDALPSELTDTAIKTLLIWHSVKKEGYPPVYDVSQKCEASDLLLLTIQEFDYFKGCVDSFIGLGSYHRDVRDWRSAMTLAENHYLGLLAMGATPQEARAVLPNSLKTELVMTANIREWRHFLNLRCDPAAHPQMREVALLLLDKLHDAVPVCFDDLWEKWYRMRIPGDPAFRDKDE